MKKKKKRKKDKKIFKKSKKPKSMPSVVFRRDHLRFTSGIICGSGSFAVQFGDHLRSGVGLGIVCDRGSFAALYSSHRGSFAVRDHLRSNLGMISGLGII